MLAYILLILSHHARNHSLTRKKRKIGFPRKMHKLMEETSSKPIVYKMEALC
jgi:hypothetical protein